MTHIHVQYKTDYWLIVLDVYLISIIERILAQLDTISHGLLKLNLIECLL